MGRAALAFSLVALVVTVTPGLDTALVVRNTLRHGRRAGVDTALGICSGLIAWGFATALGITVLLRASRTGYDVLRIAGAVWLIVLGVRTLRDSRRDAGADEADSRLATTPAHRHSRLDSYRAGLASNLLNPKVGVFYLTLLPQFIPAGVAVLAATMLLVAIHVVQGVVWLSLIAWLTARARAVLGQSWRRMSESLTGVVLVGLGVRLAIERR